MADHLGTNIDATVQKLSTQYDVLDRPTLLSSEGPTSGGWGVVNQVKNIYNSFGNLVAQDQQGSGSVAANGPGAVVQYFYDSAVPTRLDHITYPDGRVRSANRSCGSGSRSRGERRRLFIAGSRDGPSDADGENE